MFSGARKIAVKLAVLAGIPVIGALLLSVEIGNSARERSQSADAIGSVEDLAELSSRMTATVDELQTERALAALTLGLRQATPTTVQQIQSSESALKSQEAKTDGAVAQMQEFLAQRELARLPSRRLHGALMQARADLARIQVERHRTDLLTTPIDGLMEYYSKINDALINATAALTRMCNDGQLMRALSSLLALMQVQERASREHAVLSHSFAAGEFAPGMYRVLVTLTTERTVYSASLQSFATMEQIASYQRALQERNSRQAAGMLEQALEVTEEGLTVDPNAWFSAQAEAVHGLALVEKEYAQNVQAIARGKLAESRRAVRYGEALVLGVIVISLTLAMAIGGSITRSVLALVSVAGKVRNEQDFSLRAQKTTSDEVGTLTEAFNEMLSGIQLRDQELRSHRENLEQTVHDRTLELSNRNEDMRLVLDTVEQGLATLNKDGCIAPECSRAFDSFFGPPEAGVPFFRHIAGSDAELSNALEQDWALVISGAAFVEGGARPSKSLLQIDQRHFAVAYKPIYSGGSVQGALLTISDVTSEVSDAAAREQLEKELQLAQKLEGVGQLAAGVAHEINTPMQYVGDNLLFLNKAFDKISEHLNDTNVALAKTDSNSLDQVRRAIEASKARLKLPYLLKNTPKALQDSSAGIAHVSSIVRAMKSFAHVDGDEKTTGDVNQALCDTLVVAQNEYRSVAVIETDLGQIPTVMCFPGRLNQVFLNLIVNAAHAVADAKPEAGGKISVTSRAADGVVAVTIADNGGGIPKHIRDKVFDPFFTTKAVGKGTGQGLSIARSIIVDAHGGTLSFETEPGRGTAFTIRLPVDGRQSLV
ncbi:MAG: nitrate- and nitrite sensing domain-containing protein [Pseudomonadota bacterium]